MVGFSLRIKHKTYFITTYMNIIMRSSKHNIDQDIIAI